MIHSVRWSTGPLIPCQSVPSPHPCIPMLFLHLVCTSGCYYLFNAGICYTMWILENSKSCSKRHLFFKKRVKSIVLKALGVVAGICLCSGIYPTCPVLIPLRGFWILKEDFSWKNVYFSSENLKRLDYKNLGINSLKFTQGLFAFKTHKPCNKGNKASLNPLVSKPAFSAEPGNVPVLLVLGRFIPWYEAICNKCKPSIVVWL